MKTSIDELLDRSATASEAAARRFSHVVGPSDLAQLLWAFHYAESMALDALQQAVDQVAEHYRPALIAQTADERRHVALFRDWLEEAPGTPERAPRTHPEHTWFALLLLNEIAGFCQFHMLGGLLDDDRRARLRDVLTDEREHVERLVRWLEPVQRARPTILQRTGRRFQRNLPNRMRVLLPAEHLAELRSELRAIISELVVDLMPAARAEQPKG